MKRQLLIELTERRKTVLAEGDLDYAIAESICRDFGNIVDVDFPSPKNGRKWELTPKGYVGFIPIDRDVILKISPKLPLLNVFRMLEITYGGQWRVFDEGTVLCDTLEELFELIAALLVRLVGKRIRNGLYKTYQRREERLQTVRGRIDTRRLHENAYRVGMQCRYSEQTVDNEDNRLIFFALRKLFSMQLCKGRTASELRALLDILRSACSYNEYSINDFKHRSYNRLNADYGLIHALCCLFVENMGPAHEVGEQLMVPFLIDMEKLFEKFLSEWLKRFLPHHFFVREQVSVELHRNAMQPVEFRIDLTLNRVGDPFPAAVADTKYKDATSPSSADVQQIVAYATCMNAPKALLIYPNAIDAYEFPVGSVSVRCIGFDLSQDIVSAGRSFLQTLKSFLPIAV